MLRFTPLRTWLSPKDFQRSLTWITSRPHGDEGDDVVCDEDRDRAHHHPARRPLADALRAAERRVAAPGGDDRDDRAEHDRLVEAVEDVAGVQELPGVLDVRPDGDPGDEHP